MTSRRKTATAASIVSSGKKLRLWSQDGSAYERFYPEIRENHVVDAKVTRLPALRRLQRRAIAISAQLQSMAADPKKWVALSDARLDAENAREQLLFDIGHDLGVVEGRANAQRVGTQSARERDFRDELRTLIAAASLSGQRVLVVLLQHALALAFGAPGEKGNHAQRALARRSC